LLPFISTAKSRRRQGRKNRTRRAFLRSRNLRHGLRLRLTRSADYKSPFPFPGTVNKVEIDIAPTNLSQADKKKIEIAAVQALVARQ
jgi:hypothetical protein